MQELPPRERAVLILCEVLGFSAKEVGAIARDSVASVNSALQRARRVIDERVPERSQAQTLRELGDERTRAIVEAYIEAMGRGDVPRVVSMLTEDVTWSMPPLASWYEGISAVEAFLRNGPMSGQWDWRHRAAPLLPNGQLAVGTYSPVAGVHRRSRSTSSPCAASGSPPSTPSSSAASIQMTRTAILGGPISLSTPSGSSRSSGASVSPTASTDRSPVPDPSPAAMSSRPPASLYSMNFLDTDNPDRKRWLALYVLCAGMLMIVLDGTIVNVALPSIQEDLGFSQSNLAWVVNAYLIPFGGLLLLAGRLGDLLGQRRVFLVGLDRLHDRLAALRRLAGPGRCWSAPASSRGSAGRSPRR